jgi:hypothetical protein
MTDNPDHEYRIARSLVSLADTLVDEFDLAEFLHMLVEHCVALLDVDAAAVLLVDRRGGVRMAAASSEKAELLELFAVEASCTNAPSDRPRSSLSSCRPRSTPVSSSNRPKACSQPEAVSTAPSRLSTRYAATPALTTSASPMSPTR